MLILMSTRVVVSPCLRKDAGRSQGKMDSYLQFNVLAVNVVDRTNVWAPYGVSRPPCGVVGVVDVVI